MKRLTAIAIGLLAIASGMVGCAYQPIGPAETGWVTLFDGSNLNGWTPVGDANWRLQDGLAQAELERVLVILISLQNYHLVSLELAVLYTHKYHLIIV